MRPDQAEDALEKALERGHVADDGFSDRVVAALPPARRRVPRIPILAGATAIGALIAAVSPGSPHFARLMFEVQGAASGVTAAIVLASVLAVLVGSAVQAGEND